jgi:hypothetical protein
MPEKDFFRYYASHGAIITGGSYVNGNYSIMATGGEAKGGSGEMIIYQAPDKSNQIEVRMEGGTIWLTQKQMEIGRAHV